MIPSEIKTGRGKNSLLYCLLTLYTQVDSSLNWFSNSWRKPATGTQREQGKKWHQPDENEVVGCGKLAFCIIYMQWKALQDSHNCEQTLRRSSLKARRYRKRFLNENFSMSWSWLRERNAYSMHWSGQLVTRTCRNEPNPRKIGNEFNVGVFRIEKIGEF